MSRFCSHKSTTDVALQIDSKKRRESSTIVSDCTIITATSLLSKKYGLLPCFCDYDSIGMMRHRRASLRLPKSSNAFWHRNSNSKGKLIREKQQRNNSTAFENQQVKLSTSRNFQIFRKPILQRFKRKSKRKMPTITARSVVHKRTNINAIGHRNNAEQSLVDSLCNIQPSCNLSSSTQNDSHHSSYDSYRLVLHDDSHHIDDDENKKDTLQPPVSSLKTEQQNINATNKISKTIQETPQTNMNEIKSLRKIKHTTEIGSKTNPKRINHGRSPFSNPNIFHSIPSMQNSDEITKDNIHENHLCCKPISSVKNLSISDQKKLIEHNHLTLISLLPIYLDSQNNFEHKIREKTNISHNGASELNHLMNEWGSVRLFIGANSHYKALSQAI
ncbi:unnamed protein product [Rotaria magnacalcarata]|uniref:Uncharacterized protein n=1 Tax=Rotaria magnacalcarata TaxID=392030 RepID=A0A815IZN9_9BILA|nr:unnamed protein product [Rotaria magnacalcarata]CAF3772482.1 unnamed protein product [Rotaria magnacalcarata]CAF3783891.1 unnamed protein product [Rotaria magnacalcarata]CAF3796121.1 unnamed protein product [Rotaria magnacalcarata]CAF3910999.1 unnamed protein product [Rotaria magnacalcarata]